MLQYPRRVPYGLYTVWTLPSDQSLSRSGTISFPSLFVSPNDADASELEGESRKGPSEEGEDSRRTPGVELRQKAP